MLALGPATPTGTVDRTLLQRRVANVGLVLTAIGGAFIVMRVISVLAVGRPGYLASTSMVAHYGALSVSAIWWLACRGRVLEGRTIHIIELLGLAGSSTLYAVMATGIPQAFRPEMTILLAFGMFLLAHAVHVPSTWQWTAVLGIALAGPLLIGSWAILNPMDPRLVAASASSPGSVQRSAASIMAIGMASVGTWWLVIVCTACAASAVIYGLRHEVRAARRLGQYNIEGKLGEGGMGVVYRASHAMLRRPTAVKLLAPEKAGLETIARFEREVQLTARLTHPNTITIFDYGRTPEGIFYYAMELLEGANLEDVVAVGGALPAGRVIHVASQIAGALVEAHAAGLIHRDIKPANVILCERGGVPDVVKVVDFGLVREVDAGNTALSRAGTVSGTPLYLAPEAMRAPDRIDARADMYALGCVMYYLLAGDHVFRGRTTMEVCAHHLHTEPTPLGERAPSAPPADLAAIVMSCLTKDPAERLQSAAELLTRLRGCADASAWSTEQARAWWTENAAKLRAHHAAHPSSPASTIAIDLDRR
jgi:hypothetical protein